MKVTETLNEGLKRGYAISITAAELDSKVEEKLKEAQPEVEMKGFRKGKVPMPILKKQFGERILGEAMQESIDGAMSKHFEDSGDRPGDGRHGTDGFGWGFGRFICCRAGFFCDS